MRIYKATASLVFLQLCRVGFAAPNPGSILAPNSSLTSTWPLALPPPLELTSTLPSDPSVYPVPQSSQVITFSHFTRTLKREDVLACLLEAALGVIKELNLGHDGPVDAEEIQANSNNVHLILRPDPRLTWKMWGTTITGISGWVERYEFLDCDFDIAMLGYSGNFGTGNLVYL